MPDSRRSAGLGSDITALPAKCHSPVPNELLFFRGIAGENVAYMSGLRAEVILTGYCSQEKRHTGDAGIFEVLWDPTQITKTSGTSEEVRDRVKHDHPGGFSGSLVWNTRFVEHGCDLSRWRPIDAVVTGLLRRYDVGTGTLLAWPRASSGRRQRRDLALAGDLAREAAWITPLLQPYPWRPPRNPTNSHPRDGHRDPRNYDHT
jgi:hypothetical protein